MSKKRKICLVIAVLCALVIVAVSAIGIYHYNKNKITYILDDTLPDGGGKRATVILLGGQSNASGCSLNEYLERNVSTEKYDEYESGFDNVYINYRSGIYKTSNGFVKCAAGQGELEDAFGPELGIADKLNELYPDETFFIIKCAWGATDLYSQWLSPSSDGKTGKLYRHFVAFIDASIDYLISKNYDVKIEGMCWMQGESDSFMTDTASNYGTHLNNFIADIRKRFDRYASDDGIAFIDAYIAENPMYWVYYEMVNQGKTEVSELSELNTVVKTSDLICTGEPYEQADVAHYDSMSEITLGHRFAEALVPYLG